MANAAATLVGQNLGAGRADRAETSVWRTAFYNMSFLAIVTVLFYSMATPIISIFTTDPEVLKNGVLCLKIVSVGYIFYAYGMVVGQSFNGAGDTSTPTVVSFCGFWLFQIPVAYALAHWLDTGTVGVYSAIPAAESLMAVAFVVIFRRGNWKKTTI